MLALVLSVILLVLTYWVFKKPSHLPPGRWGLPVIGYIPLHPQDASKVVSELKKKYGDIFTWKIGRRVMVGLCDYKLIKTTFSRPECQGRPDLLTRHEYNFSSNTGLIQSVGNVWSEGRRFALRHLKDFGMGKSSMEGVIQYEAVALAESYDTTTGKPVEFTWNLNVAVLNVIWKLVADRRYETNDEEIMKFNKMLATDLDIVQGIITLLDIFPKLHKILPNFILYKWMKLNLLREHLAEFKYFFEDIIEEHEKTFDPNNPRDYIDAYLKEIQEERGNPNTIFKEDRLNLVSSVTSLFRAGSETTSSTTRWLVALMAIHPEIQKKMQTEIDDVVPRDQAPTLNDKPKMPYTEAVIMEVHRFASLLPMGLFHSNTEDIKIGDYDIPKGTMMFAHSESCHRDPKYWKKPNDFYPQHFLDDNGKFLSKKEGFLPFSLGRRQCLGENLAKMELFLFTTCLFQRFFIAPPKGVTILAESDPTRAIFNFIKPYKVVMTRRD